MVDPEHGIPLLQLLTSAASPIQSLRLRLVVRSTQTRDLCWVPPAQVCEHAPQVDQPDHTPAVGHTSVLQDIDCREDPTQLFPFRQVRTLTLCPPPQLRLHALHCPHGPHLAAAVEGRQAVQCKSVQVLRLPLYSLYVFALSARRVVLCLAVSCPSSDWVVLSHSSPTTQVCVLQLSSWLFDPAQPVPPLQSLLRVRIPPLHERLHEDHTPHADQLPVLPPAGMGTCQCS